MTELLEQYPAALEIIHSHFEGPLESSPATPTEPTNIPAEAEVETGNDDDEAPYLKADIRQILSTIFKNPTLTKNLVEKNPGMIAELFRSIHTVPMNMHIPYLSTCPWGWFQA